MSMATVNKHGATNPAKGSALSDLPCFLLYVGWRKAQEFYKPLLAEAGSPQRMYVLTLLSERDGLSIGELAAELDVDSPTMSGLVARMEKAGHVERRPSSESRRAVAVTLTKPGRKLFDKLHGEIEAADTAILEMLRKGDVAALRRIVAAFGAMRDHEAALKTKGSR